MNPIKAIRAKCLDCSGGNAAEVRECRIEDCALHPFRMGSNPFRKRRVLTPEQRERSTAALRDSREKRQERAQEEVKE
jgi:hypothetical protein